MSIPNGAAPPARLDRAHLAPPDPSGEVRLPGTPWLMRPAEGAGGRAALEVYADRWLIDVMVAPSLALRILRGARCARWAGRRSTLAWGCLPVFDEALSVVFTRGRLRPRRRLAEARNIAGWFWCAVADGRFDRVAVVSDGATAGPGARVRRRPGIYGGRIPGLFNRTNSAIEHDLTP